MYEVYLKAISPNQVSAAMLAALLPVIKVCTTDRYMIGAEVHKVELRGKDLFIRIAGGFQPLTDFIRKESIAQSVQILKRMNTA